MTLKEIRKSDKEMLTPYEVGEVLGSDPATIRETAKQHPERIGFNYCFIGTRMKIPREAFIKWMDGDR